MVGAGAHGKDPMAMTRAIVRASGEFARAQVSFYSILYNVCFANQSLLYFLRLNTVQYLCILSLSSVKLIGSKSATQPIWLRAYEVNSIKIYKLIK